MNLIQSKTAFRSTQPYRSSSPTMTSVLAKQIPSNSCSSSSDSDNDVNSGSPRRNMYVRCPLPNIKLYGDHPINRFREEEKSRALNPHYKTNFQTDIEDQDRDLVVSGIFSICSQLEVSDGAIFLAVKMFDYLLSKVEIPRQKLKSYAYCCILLATKSEDIWQTQIVERLCHLGEDVQDSVLLELEFEVFKDINYNVLFSTVFIFLTHYISSITVSNQDSLDLLYNTSRFFAFAAISTDSCTFNYDSETIAFSCLLLGNLAAQGKQTFAGNSSSFPDLDDCSRTIFDHSKFLFDHSEIHEIFYLSIKNILNNFYQSNSKESINFLPTVPQNPEEETTKD